MENTQEQKTPEMWFQQLKEPYRSEAIKNINTEYTYYEETTKSLKDAIQFSFDWLDSRQRHTYWSKIYNSIRKGETTYLEPETLKPEPIELRPEDLVKGEVYTLVDKDKQKFTFFCDGKGQNRIHYREMFSHVINKGFTIDYIDYAPSDKIYHATPEEKKLLLGEEEPTDWEAKYNELKAKYDQLEPKGEKVYFYLDKERNHWRLNIDKQIAIDDSENHKEIYEAVKIGVKKSVLVNE